MILRLSGLCLLETRAAQHRPALRGTEGDGRFLATRRAMGPRFRSHARTTVRTLRLALLAVLGIVFELLVVEEKLLAGGEYEFSAAVVALEDSILEFHGRLPRRKEES